MGALFSRRILEEATEKIMEYFGLLGHQALLVHHCGSKKDPLNYHSHVIVNPVSYITDFITYSRHLILRPSKYWGCAIHWIYGKIYNNHVKGHETDAGNCCIRSFCRMECYDMRTKTR